MPTVKSFNKRLEALRSERSSFIPVWMELSDYHLAHRGRFLTSDRNLGFKKNTKQYNNTSHMAARTLAAGMMAGITSPARPWFKLAASDPDLNELSSVKEWLHVVQTLMYRVFSQSNLYNSLHTLYAELGVFGTAALGIFHDFENVIWCKPYTIGSYMIASNAQDEIDTLYREYEISVGQVVKDFGLENCSRQVQQLWKTGNTEAWIKIVHAVEPNDDRDDNNPLAKFKKFRSVYYEQDTKQDQFLKESGFDEFPIMVPRWDITGEDIYATDCPGMTTLGDTKALQLGEKRKYQAVDKIVNPPMQGDISLKNQMDKGVQPGETIWTDANGSGLRSVYEGFRPDINAIMMVNKEAEDRIKRGFYEDLFLMMINSDRRQITAREVAEKQEEKLLMLGSVLERLHAELLDPLIDRTFAICQKAGLIPPAPEEVQGSELNVEYVSILAQAQRLVAVSGLERVAGFASQLTSIWPEVRHKFDAMQAVDEFAESVGVNPRVIRPDDETNAIVAAERQAQQQAQQAQQVAQVAETAKIGAEAQTGGDNLLSTLMRSQGLI